MRHWGAHAADWCLLDAIQDRHHREHPVGVRAVRHAMCCWLRYPNAAAAMAAERATAAERMAATAAVVLMDVMLRLGRVGGGSG